MLWVISYPTHFFHHYFFPVGDLVMTDRARILLSLFALAFLGVFLAGCESAKSRIIDANAVDSRPAQQLRNGIRVVPKSPADTVREFYRRLRANEFRSALLLTNLRTAVEGLTESEIEDLRVDFGHLAGNVPSALVINGEIISGERASVMIMLPDESGEGSSTEKIDLRKDAGSWIILTLDPKAEAEVKKLGKDYFFALRLKTHHDEAKAMMERVLKAQLVYSAGNEGRFGTLDLLVGKGLLPKDITSTVSTGYVFELEVPENRRSFTAHATPETYGKSGKYSYLLKVEEGKDPLYRRGDNAGNRLE